MIGKNNVGTANAGVRSDLMNSKRISPKYAAQRRPLAC